MSTNLVSTSTPLERAAMIDRVVAAAKRDFHGQASERDLARWAAAAVVRLWRDGPTVTSFVPTLALREVRDRVQSRHAAPAGRPADRAAEEQPEPAELEPPRA